MATSEMTKALKGEFPGITDEQSASLQDSAFDATGSGIMSALSTGFSQAEKADCLGAQATLGGNILALPSILRNHSNASVKESKKCWPDYHSGEKVLCWESKWKFRAPSPGAGSSYRPNVFVRQLLIRFTLAYNPKNKERNRIVRVFTEVFRINRASGETLKDDDHAEYLNYAPEGSLGGYCMLKSYEVGFLQLVFNDSIPGNEDFAAYGYGEAQSRNEGNSFELNTSKGQGSNRAGSKYAKADVPLNVSGRYQALHAPCHCGIGAYPEQAPTQDGGLLAPYEVPPLGSQDRGPGSRVSRVVALGAISAMSPVTVLRPFDWPENESGSSGHERRDASF